MPQAPSSNPANEIDPSELLTVFMAEGSRVGLATCRECSACILIDPRDPVDRVTEHSKWHYQQALNRSGND